MIYLLGENGRLGKAFSLGHPADVIAINSLKFQNSLTDGTLENLLENINEEDFIVYALGKTNPNDPLSQLNFANQLLPTKIYEATTKNRPKIVTFGTVMERLKVANNPYIASKRRYSNFVETVDHPERLLNIQLHTLYGSNYTHPHMFLGQIFNALHLNQEFVMSSGTQLREYWHIEDVVSTIIPKFARANLFGNRDLSSGKPVTLRFLATSIFSYFGKETLLEINEADYEKFDNHSEVLPESDSFNPIIFREQIDGVITYLEKLLESAKNEQ